jgi:CRP-like cAMP-binding protein
MPLGAALPVEERAQLLKAGEVVGVARGDRPDSDRIWLVARGALRGDLPLAGGTYQLELLGPGRLAGATAMLAETSTASGLTATEASLLIGWDAPAFRALLARDAALAMRLGAAINADLVTTLDALDGVEARIAAMQRALASEV